MTFTDESLANPYGDAPHFILGDWIAVVHEYDGSCLRERASVKPPLWDARLGKPLHSTIRNTSSLRPNPRWWSTTLSSVTLIGAEPNIYCWKIRGEALPRMRKRYGDEWGSSWSAGLSSFLCN